MRQKTSLENSGFLNLLILEHNFKSFNAITKHTNLIGLLFMQHI